MVWSNKKSLLIQLEKLWGKGLLLQEYLENNMLFPKRLSFKTPDNKALRDEFNSIRRWIAEVQKLTGFRIVYKTLRHRVIGENTIPSEAWVDTLESAIALLNKHQQLAQFECLVTETRERTPELINWVKRYPLKALALTEIWSRLLDCVVWRKHHPHPDIYLRQVSLPGIDSKFIEQNRSVLAALLDLALPPEQIKAEATGVKQFECRFGFRSKPEKIRFRLLDTRLALLPGTDADISLTTNDFRSLHQKSAFASQLKRVFITENEINFLAFPPQNNSMVIFGAGYGFDALAEATWLTQKEIFYWGDIDTHGFIILDQLRSKFAHVQSILMNESTLMAHQEFWGQELKPEYRELHQLTDDEQNLYQALLANKHAEHLRLEQERIRYDDLISALSSIKK